MISLDFKLSSGQVRTLLAIYHGSTQDDFEEQYRSGFIREWHTSHFVTTGNSLLRKGLATHQNTHARNEQSWNVTERGRIVAEMLVEHARKIVALDESRMARAARRAAAGVEATP